MYTSARWRGGNVCEIKQLTIQGPSDFMDKESPSIKCQRPLRREEERVDGQGTLLSLGWGTVPKGERAFDRPMA